MLVLAGAAAAIFVAGGTGEILAFVLIALGFVLLTSLVFYEVGLSEDRERERRRGAQADRPPRRPRLKPRRLGRERDHTRRLR